MREDLLRSIKANQTDQTIVHKQFSGTVKAFDVEARTAKFVISTGTIDRDGDTINPAGWDLSAFKSNPVVLWSHNTNVPPIGKATEILTKGGGKNKKLVATAQFATKEQHELADTVFQLIVGGFLSATSVGFQPIELEFDDDRGGIDFLKQELHEFSIVPVPSNPEATLTAAKDAGVDVTPMLRWAEYTLDHFKHKEAEVLYKLIKAPVKQVDLTDLPEEVSMVLEMIELDLPGVKDALGHAISEDAEPITTFEGDGNAVEPLPQADGDGTEDVDIVDPGDGSSLGQGDKSEDSIDLDPEDLKSVISAEVKLQVAAVTGKLPE